MNRSSVRQKRSIGKSSPLSKRPKLDFTLRSRDSLSDIREECISNGKAGRDLSTSAKHHEIKTNGNFPKDPDWDDDFSGDMLEKVCLIADLSQAMVKNQTEKLTKTNVQILEENQVSPAADAESSRPDKDFERLKLEFQELQEKFKTKEGEVHILRSQLKQNEETKQAAALQNIKIVEEIKKNFNDKIILTEKELETTKTKLQFKEMEYKTLSERCRQLEYSLSKNKLCDASQSQAFSTFTQVIPQKVQNKETGEADTDTVSDSRPTVEFSHFVQHEGEYLEKILCPEIFEFIEEPNIVHYYAFESGISYYNSKLNFDKKGQYKWTEMPKQTVFLKDFYDSISSLFAHDCFNRKDVEKKIKRILEFCRAILTYNKEVLVFLDNLNLKNCEYDDSDQSLLENEDEVKIITVKNLLRGKVLVEEECGIEGRRSLALIYALMMASRTASDWIKTSPEFIILLKILAEKIGNLRKPLRYSGILVGIAFILQKLLQEKDLDNQMLSLISEIVEELIFARPKLDVLIEVVNILASGRNHSQFLIALCRKASLDSCSLYMDSKLKQAMFFTKCACPLKILCMQIMGLACLHSSRQIKWDLTHSTIKWLNNSINTRDCRKIKWLPLNSAVNDEERCFDVTECLLYLLTLCLKDYNLRFLYEDHSGPEESLLTKVDSDNKNKFLSIIGNGAVLLKRILKSDQRQLHDNTYSVRFAMLLNSLVLNNSDASQKNSVSHLSSVQTEAISWLIDSLEGDLRNHDCYIRQSTSVISEADVLSALRINDETKIY